MISASKTTFSLNNIKILRLKVKKNLTNLRKKFCESPPWRIILLKLLKRTAKDLGSYNTAFYKLNSLTHSPLTTCSELMSMFSNISKLECHERKNMQYNQ